MKAVTLDDLMQGPKKVTIPVAGKPLVVSRKGAMPETPKIEFWVRQARQNERDLAAAAARKESRTLRKILETDGTEERQRLVLDELEGASIDSLKSLWVTEKVVERAIRLRNSSLEDREYVPEPEGDNITSKDVDNYENEVEEVEQKRELGVLEAVDAARKELEAEVEKVPNEKLMDLAIPAQIESILTRAYETEFTMQLIFRCTFEDRKCTKRAFSLVDQVYSLKEHPLTMLTNAHMSLLIDPEQVKNLAGGLNSST